MNSKIILVLLWFSFGTAFSQQQIKGKVVANKAGIGQIMVVNLNAQKETQTDAEGNFAIAASDGDLLIFTAPQFRKTRLVVDQSDFGKVLEIQVEGYANQLDEVEVNNTRINPEDLGLVPRGQKTYTPAERRLLVATGNVVTVGTGFSIGLDPLLNLISGRTTMLKSELVVERRELLLKKLEVYFSDEYIQGRLKIQKDYVDAFKDYSIENSKFAEAMQMKNKTLASFIIMELALEYNKKQ